MEVKTDYRKKEQGGTSMKKIWLISILILNYLVGLPNLQAQSEEDFEQTGLKHFENRIFQSNSSRR